MKLQSIVISGFSILNTILTHQRNRFKPETLESLMPIKINGPTISEFNPLQYSKTWVQEGHHTMIDIYPAPKRTNIKDEDEDDVEIFHEE